MKKGYLQSRWGQLHFRQNTPLGRSIVAFHESPLSSFVFDGLLDAADGDLHVVAPDTPGYGASDPPEQREPIEEYASVMWDALRNKMSSSGEVWLLGSHTGACIALEVALQNPGTFEGIILSGTPVFSESRRWRYAECHTPDLTPQADGSHLTRAWNRYVEKASRGTSPNSLAFMTEAATIIAANWCRYSWAYQSAFRYDTAGAFQSFQGRIFLLNSENDSCAPYDSPLTSLRDDVLWCEIPHVSGRPYWVAPDLYSKAVLALLELPADCRGQMSVDQLLDTWDPLDYAPTSIAGAVTSAVDNQATMEE